MKYLILLVGLLLVCQAHATVIQTTFESDTGVKFYGDAFFHNGQVVLTESAEDRRGGIKLGEIQSSDTLESWNANINFTISELFRGGADGLSFGLMREDAVFNQWSFAGEEGISSGLAVGFDSYDNNEGSANHVSVRYDGALLAQVNLKDFGIDLKTDTDFDTGIMFNNGLLDVMLNGSEIVSNFAVVGWNSYDGQFYMSARTGYSASRQSVSSISIHTVDVPESPTLLLLLLPLSAMVLRRQK